MDKPSFEKTSEYKDKELICHDCKKPFTLTSGEQEFFASKGFQEPKRCNPCRKKKTATMKEQRNQANNY